MPLLHSSAVSIHCRPSIALRCTGVWCLSWHKAPELLSFQREWEHSTWQALLKRFTLRSQPPFPTIKALCTAVLFWESPSRNTKAFHVGNCTLTVFKQGLLVRIKQAKQASGYHFPAPLSLFCVGFVLLNSLLSSWSELLLRETSAMKANQ